MAATQNALHSVTVVPPDYCELKRLSCSQQEEVGAKGRIDNWWNSAASDKGTYSTSNYLLLRISSQSNQLSSYCSEPRTPRENGKSTFTSPFAICPSHGELESIPRADSADTHQSSSTVACNAVSCISTDLIFARLQQCIDDMDLEAGRKVHWLAIQSGLDSNAFVGSHLIRMFAHFDRLTEANQAFHRIVNPNLYSWNAIMLAYVKSGHHQIALKVYQDLQNSCPELDGHIFVSALRTCFSPVNLGQGRQIHMQAIENGFEFDDYVGSTLVEMYAKCSDLESALAVFNRLPRWRAISCSLLIGGFVDAGEEYIALELFTKMVEKDVELDEVSYISILEACSNIAALGHGRQIHALLIELGLEFDVRVGNAIIDVYVNCQRLLEADTLFHRLPVKDIVTWTTLASGYAYNGFNKEAMQIFDDMEHHGVTPNSITLVLILRACSSVSALEQGRRIHARIVECGTELDDFAGSSLIDMYGKCGSPDDAIIMFERLPKTTAIAWSALIAGTADNEEGSKAFLLFEQMQRENVIPDRALFVCILKACSDPTHLDYGRFIHCHVAESGLGTDIFLANALIDMYVKCESLEDACTLSKTLPEQDLVTWSLLIGGHVQQGFALEALQFFDKMCKEGVEPDGTSFVCALKACSSIAALQQGRRIHGQAIEKGYELDPFVSSTLIDMYAKCGSLEDAQRDFERLPKPNIVDWGALMSGYAQIGNYSLVLQYFKAMQSRGIEPDEISFLSLLAACSRAGLLDAGCAHFKEMRDNHGSVPSLKHYNSLVDIFGHTGCLEEVEDLLETIPFGNNLVGWTSLLTSCRRYFDPSTGRRSFDRFIVMDRTNATGYVLMENIYSQMGMWDDANEIEELRKYANGWKKPGKAFIEIGNQVHNFAVGDKSHKESSAIYAKLEGLNLQLQEEGYVPRVDLVMDSTSEDDKVDALCGHCEKLAIAFGLISTVPGTTLRVSKNLRMCADCHNATRLISKLERREIIVVDAYCTHHFGNGICSCTEHL